MPSLSRTVEDEEPLVTIGIPVYQKETHLRETLDSALQQTHRNLEFVLADNGSTDATAAICRDYAARDRRVRFVENRQNLGSRRNFNLVFELSHGKYFVWGRGHDLWEPTFVASSVAILENAPEVVLVHTRCREIDSSGIDIGPVAECLDTRGFDLRGRLMATWRDIIGPATLGVVRTAAMDRTRLYQDLGGSDIVFLLELAREGSFAFLDETLLRLRRVRSEHSEAETVQRTWAQINPFRTRRESPHCHILEYTQKHIELIRELPLDAAQRDQLLTDLIIVYGEKFLGSYTRALDTVAERIEAAARTDHTFAPIDVSTALHLLDQVQTALLFQPDHVRATAARDQLLHLMLDLTSVPEKCSP